MTDTLAASPELSISSSSESSNGHSPRDDHDFFDRLLVLQPESESKNNPPLAEDHVASDAVVNLDPAASCPTDAIPYGHATRGHISSLKPTIFPANALRLHLDGPSTQPTTLHPPSSTPNPDFRPGRVHFRSRVRITSGFSRHRRKSDTGSSRSCSSSSSTSAPLRSHPHDNTTTWGTLGQRVGLLALQRKILGSPKLRPRHTQGTTVPTENVNERTPLRNSFDYLPYVEGGGVQGDVFGEDSDDERSSHEMDDIFGTYPLRLLNPRWWYWQLEPIICCHDAAEFE